MFEKLDGQVKETLDHIEALQIEQAVLDQLGKELQRERQIVSPSKRTGQTVNWCLKLDSIILRAMLSGSTERRLTSVGNYMLPSPSGPSVSSARGPHQ